MTRSRTMVPATAGTLALLFAIGCGLPTKQDVDLQQAVYDIGTAVEELQGAQGDLQGRIDSLSAVVARQDSTLRALANLMGSPLPR